MADIKISQLGEALAVTDNDILPMTASGVTSKVKASTMKSYMVDDLDVSDLHDTTITTPTDNDGLVYNATAQKWENVPITTKEQWKKNGAYNVGYHNFTTQTLNGITFTVNADKSITLNNTATATTTIHLFQATSASTVGLKEGTTYKLVGLTPTTPSCTLKVNCYYNSANHVAEDSGNGATFTFTGTSYGDFFYDYYLTIPSGTAFNNDTIYPMISTDLNATYADYVPYAKTNRELTIHTVKDNFCQFAYNDNICIGTLFVNNLSISTVGDWAEFYTLPSNVPKPKYGVTCPAVTYPYATDATNSAICEISALGSCKIYLETSSKRPVSQVTASFMYLI